MATEQVAPKADWRTKAARAARKAGLQAQDTCKSATPSEAREAQIRGEAEALGAAQVAAAMEHAKSAAMWIAAQRPDVSMGSEPMLLLIADDDNFSLPELEDYGRAGNAIMLCDGSFGQLWWCDPEGRKTASHECLLYTARATQTATSHTILLRFNLPKTTEASMEFTKPQTTKRVIAGGGETSVGGVAWSEVPEGYEGLCRVSFRSGSGRLDVEVFPSYCEAYRAARCGVSVEIGGYCEAHITAATESETVTHQTHGSWLGE